MDKVFNILKGEVVWWFAVVVVFVLLIFDDSFDVALHG